MIVLRAISFLLALFLVGTSDVQFTYKAPELWNTQFPSCNGRRQSPVNIVTSQVLDKVFPPLCYVHYDDTPLNSSILNNGHTARVHVDVGHEAPYIFGGPLTGKYQLAQYHFHWGVNDSVGSEHLINGHGFPLELHLVHWNTKYKNFSNALEHPDGLAVLAVISEMTSGEAKAFKFLNNLFKVRQADTETVSKSLPSLLELLPDRVQEYYTLPGSLTVPTCNEVVTWIIFRSYSQISSMQLRKFRLLRDKRNKRMRFNNRPTQPLCGRTVYRSV
jgi:carbonic anhydrase